MMKIDAAAPYNTNFNGGLKTRTVQKASSKAAENSGKIVRKKKNVNPLLAVLGLLVLSLGAMAGVKGYEYQDSKKWLEEHGHYVPGTKATTEDQQVEEAISIMFYPNFNKKKNHHEATIKARKFYEDIEKTKNTKQVSDAINLTNTTNPNDTINVQEV